MSLDVETREVIRNDGTVRNCPNPSATLMKRIRQRGGGGFVPYRMTNSGSGGYRGARGSGRERYEYIGKARGKEVVVFLRGEAFRVGGNKEHRPEEPTETLEENVISINTFLVAPLQEQGYSVLVFADIMGDAARLNEVRNILERVFGASFREARVKMWLSGPNQISSVISSIDMLFHMLQTRGKEHSVLGAYVLRVDTRLLQQGTSDWPLDKLCFPWKTRWMELPRSVNDVLFYIPSALFDKFRDALTRPGALDNLHWLGDYGKHPQRGRRGGELQRSQDVDEENITEKARIIRIWKLRRMHNFRSCQ
jgi:hypothetical protein